MPSSRAARMTRTAISPRLAIRILESTSGNLRNVPTPNAIPPRPAGEPSEWPPGWHVQVVAETGSTNADLLAAALGGAADRTVLMALHQTAGRGRLDRRWDAPAGSNLLVSILFRNVPPAPFELTKRVGLAACTAARRLGGVEARLKWPNDVLVGDAKLAGILAQAGPDLAYVVVGLGLNVAWRPLGAARLGAGLTPATVLAGVLEAFDQQPDDIAAAYLEALATIGRRVRAITAGRTIHGTAIGVDADGRLVLDGDDGATHRLDTADVIHLR